ncbi:MAG: DUF2279 domain-containing protein [Bacteroidota bacterium]
MLIKSLLSTLLCLLFVLPSSLAQDSLQLSFWESSPKPHKKRQHWSSAIITGGYCASIGLMGAAWYSQEDLSAFHFFDDSHEWKQMDKVGHMLGGYTSSRWIYGIYRWTGMPHKKAVLVSGLSGFMMMNSIEVLDGFGETWGFSWSDVGANFIGSSLMAANQLLWQEERLQLKYSYLPSPYAGDPDYARLFGSSLPEYILKDYNGMVIWTSVRVHSFLPEGRLKEIYPRWLNLAIGYGAEDMIGNYRLDQDPLQTWKTREYRQYYLSLDFDVANIKVKSPFLRTLFQTVNIIRIPFPSVQFDRTGVSLLPLR